MGALVGMVVGIAVGAALLTACCGVGALLCYASLRSRRQRGDRGRTSSAKSLRSRAARGGAGAHSGAPVWWSALAGWLWDSDGHAPSADWEGLVGAPGGSMSQSSRLHGAAAAGQQLLLTGVSAGVGTGLLGDMPGPSRKPMPGSLFEAKRARPPGRCEVRAAEGARGWRRVQCSAGAVMAGLLFSPSYASSLRPLVVSTACLPFARAQAATRSYLAMR